MCLTSAGIPVELECNYINDEPYNSGNASIQIYTYIYTGWLISPVTFIENHIFVKFHCSYPKPLQNMY